MKRLRQAASSRLLPDARLAGPMPWVIAIMIALTVIAAGAGLALRNLTENAQREIAGGFTVQVVQGAPQQREREARAVVSLLSARDEVIEVRRVPEEELNALLEPWLGANALSADDGIPIPALIDARFSSPVTDERLEELRSLLKSAAPSARVDAQARWLTPVFEAAASLMWLVLILILLLAGTSAAAVWLAARSALGSNRETIEIVHLLGGTDGQISRIFQRSVGFDAALGGTAGLAVGLATVIVLGRQFAGLGSGMVAGGGFTSLDWAILAVIPIAGVTLAILTVRLTVGSALRRIL